MNARISIPSESSCTKSSPDKVPFSGDSAIAIGFKQMKEDPAPPREMNPQVPEGVEAVILKALAKDPMGRYRSVGDLRKDLEASVLQGPASSIRESKRAEPESQKIRS